MVVDFWPGQIRLATASDGPAIGLLFAQCEWNDYGVQWSTVDPTNWWLLAERNGQLVGAVQLMVSLPFAYVGHFLVHPSERGRDHNGNGSLRLIPGSLAFTLLAHINALCERSGAQIILAFTHDAAWLKLLEHYGCTNLGPVTLTARRTAAWIPVAREHA